MNVPSRAILRYGAPTLIACFGTPSGAPATEVSPLETVQTTATRREAIGLDVAPGVTTVNVQELALHLPLTVVDHFRGEPGTYVQQTTPGQGTVIIRGLKGSEILHLVDGFRMNNAIFRNAPNQYIALIDPWNLERVDAVRGPMSVLYGGDAMGGVVQFITRAPRFYGDSLQARGKVGMQTSTADSSFSAHVEGEMGTDDWVVHAGLVWQDIGQLRTGGGERLPFTDFRAYGANAKLEMGLSDSDTFVIQAQYMEQPETARYDGLVPGFGQTQPDFSELLFKPQARQFVQVRWRREAPTALYDSFELQAGMQKIVDDRTTRDFDAPFRELELNSSSLVGASGQFNKALGGHHDITFGFELYHDRVDSSRDRIDLDTGTQSTRPARFPDGSTMQWIGAYVADDWSVSKRINLNGGLRYTRYETELTPTINDIGVTLEPDAVAGNVGLVFKATDHLRLVANVGRGFRAPNVFDLGTFGARGNRFNVPNTELEPERVTTFDLGMKWGGERVQGELMAFHSRYEDKITQVLTGEVDASGRLIVQSQNATRLELRGVEGGVFVEVAGGTLHATATWVRGDETFEGDTYPADRIPPLFGKVAMRWAMRESADLEATIDWAGSQERLSPRDEIDPRINPEGTAGWAILTLRAGWRPSTRLRIGFGVENVFDRRYREHGSGFDASGRGLYATVDYQH